MRVDERGLRLRLLLERGVGEEAAEDRAEADGVAAAAPRELAVWRRFVGHGAAPALLRHAARAGAPDFLR